MNNNIFFSFNICCYNSSKYLRDTLDSILNQTYKNWEIVIIDDGSTDNTSDIINEYINKDIPIKFYKQNNKGFANARNKALEMSSYNWIVIIDHDDMCFTDRLEKHLKQIKDDPDCKLFFGDTIHTYKSDYIDNHLRKFNFNNISLTKMNAAYSLLKYGCFIDSESVIFDKNSAKKINGFNENYKYLADYDFFIKMGENYNFGVTFEKLSYWRIHDQQASHKLVDTNSKELIKLFYKKFFDNKYNLIMKLHIIKKLVIFSLSFISNKMKNI